MHLYIIAHLAVSPFKQNEKSGALLELLPPGRVLFTTAFQGCPRKSCNPATVCFQVVPECCVEPSVNKAHVFSPLSVGHRDLSHEVIIVGWRKEGSVTELGTMGIWATPSGN